MSTTPIGWRPNLFPLTSHAAAAAAALKETVFLSPHTHSLKRLQEIKTVKRRRSKKTKSWWCLARRHNDTLNKKKKSKVCLLCVPHANSPASYFFFFVSRSDGRDLCVIQDTE
jgi:hypothetical protein